MKKRIIAMILSIVMVIGMLPMSVFAVEADNLRNFTKRNTYTNDTFDDVQKDDWFYENVKSVYELGLMQGKGNNRFDTESGVTIAETLTIAARLHSIYFTGTDAFETSNPWYQVYADYCNTNGIAAVNSDTYSQTATRAEFVMILANALPAEIFAENNKVSDNAIPDVKTTDSYGAAVYKMYRAGIMVGNDEIGTFAPTSEIKRSEVATIVTRMVDVSLRKSIQLGNEYTVTFNMNGHGKQIDPQTVVEGYTAEKPADPTKATYIFKGWSTQKTGGQQFDFDTPITEDITLYAHWEIDPLWLALMMGWMNGQNQNSDQTYTVTFDANGSDVENLPAPQTVRAGDCAVEPNDPTKLIHEFGGWYSDSDCLIPFDFSTPITANITLYAKWDITIYSKPLDESHVKTGTLEFEGEEFEAQYVDNELIIVVKDGVSREYVEQLVAPQGGTIVGQIPLVGFYQISFLNNSLSVIELNELINIYNNDIHIEKVYYNTLTNIDGSSYEGSWYPNDTYRIPTVDDLERFSLIWGSEQTLTWGLRASGLPQAWYMSKQSSNVEAVRVGIIDTGFSNDHDDLSIVTYGKGYGQDHGTHVAGIIGASMDNEIGCTGITFNPTLYGTAVSKGVPIAELCTYMSVLIELECKVINVSLGHKESNLTLAEKIITSSQAGTLSDVFYKYLDAGYDFLVVTAAANNGEYDHDVNYANAITKLSEHLYREHIIVVGNAFYESGIYKRNPSSGYIGNRVEIMAPGTNIYSTISNNGYAYKGGTSMASPFVAGVAALIKETVPNMSMSEIKDIILATANIDVVNSDVNMINAAEAMKEALSRIGITVPTTNDTREIELMFVDDSTNNPIEDTTISMLYLDYAGPHNFIVSGEEEIISISNSKSKIYLNDGIWKINFFSDQYDSGNIYIDVTSDTRFITARLIPIDTDQSGDDDPIVPPVGTGYTVSGRLVSATDGIGIADMGVSLVNNSNFYTATTDSNGYFEFTNVVAAPVYAFESGDGTTYEYYKDTDVAVSGATNLGTIELTPVNTSTTTMRIRFVDADSGDRLKISDIFDATSYIGIGNSKLTDNSGFISGDFIDGSKGTNAFTVNNDSELVFTNVPLLRDGYYYLGYYLIFDSGEKGYAIPEDYTIAGADITENANSELEAEIELSKLSLIVGDVTVTAENASDILGNGTASFNYNSNTLTLNNANITANTVIYTNMAYLYIDIPENTKSTLTGVSTENTSVIQATRYLQIQGGGKLEITGSNSGYAIRAGYDYQNQYELTISNVEIILPSATTTGIYADDGKLTLDGVIIEQSGADNYGQILVAKDIVIRSSKMSFDSQGNKIIWSRGGTLTITNSSIAIGSINKAFSGDYAIFAEVGTISISGSDITILSSKTDTTVDNYLLSATNGMTVDANLTINNESELECEVYQGERGFSIRCKNGTYPTQIKIAQ